MKGKLLLEVFLGSAFALVALAAIASQISESRGSQQTRLMRARAAFIADREVTALDATRADGSWKLEDGFVAELHTTTRGVLVEKRLSVQGVVRLRYELAP